MGRDDSNLVSSPREGRPRIEVPEVHLFLHLVGHEVEVGAISVCLIVHSQRIHNREERRVDPLREQPDIDVQLKINT